MMVKQMVMVVGVGGGWRKQGNDRTVVQVMVVVVGWVLPDEPDAGGATLRRGLLQRRPPIAR